MKDLIKALHRGAVDEHRCLGCEFEDDCSIHGCQVMNKAAAELERIQAIAVDPGPVSRAEKQALFRLGQMDMQQSVVLMLRKRADGILGLARSMLLLAVDCIESMDVSGSDTGGDLDG